MRRGRQAPPVFLALLVGLDQPGHQESEVIRDALAQLAQQERLPTRERRAQEEIRAQPVLQEHKDSQAPLVQQIILAQPVRQAPQDALGPPARWVNLEM